MKDQIMARIVDLLIVVVVCFVFWGTYMGYVLTTSFKNVMDGQCQIIQKQVLEQAVEKALKEKAEEETEE